MIVDTSTWEKGKDYPEWMTPVSLATISKGYLLPNETPKKAYKRVADTIATRLDKPELASKFFRYIWKGWLNLASPVLSNTGTDRGLPISCVTGDTWIMTKDGGKRADQIGIGDLVLTHRNRFREVTKVIPTKDRGDLYELKVSTRTTPIKITGDHLVLTNSGWKRVDSLDVNRDFIATNNSFDLESLELVTSINIQDYLDFSEYYVEGKKIYTRNKHASNYHPFCSEVKLTEDLMFAIGLWLADGHVYIQNGENIKGIGLTSNLKDEKHLSRSWKETIINAFGIESNNSEMISEEQSTVSNYVYSRGIGEFFLKCFGRGFKGKRIPEWVYKTSKPLQESLLLGFMAGDGHFNTSTERWSTTVANPELLTGLYYIALYTDYSISMQLQEKAGKLSSTAHVYSMSICSKEVSTTRQKDYLGIPFNDGNRYCRIKSLKSLDLKADVYDFTVEEDHSFTAAGVILHNCFGIDTPDSIRGIGLTNAELMRLTSMGGGVGISLSRIRGRGVDIGTGENGRSEGVVPWAKIYDSTIIATNQGSVRRGAASVNLDINHKDIKEFLQIRRPKGDPNRQCLNLHQCVVVDDKFMQKLEQRDMESVDLWLQVLKSRVETGEPYIMFKDNVNNANPQAYLKNNLDVSMTNICSEIVLHTDEEHSFVCCLSSVNLAKWEEWKDTDLVETAIYFLDGVLEEFLYKANGKDSLIRTYRSAKKGRALGLGVLGWHTLLQSKRIPFVSIASTSLTHQIFSDIRTKAENASRKLAEEYGEPVWCRGTGMRNTHLLAIAPTVSNSTLSGEVSAGIEPFPGNTFTANTAKGTFLRKNKTLEEYLEERGHNTEEIWQQITRDKGSIINLPEDVMPSEDKEIFLTFAEINQLGLVEQAAARQKYIDQTQSLNLAFDPTDSPKFINQVHLQAWKLGIKTLYYLRTDSVIQADIGSRTDLNCLSCDG